MPKSNKRKRKEAKAPEPTVAGQPLSWWRDPHWTPEEIESISANLRERQAKALRDLMLSGYAEIPLKADLLDKVREIRRDRQKQYGDSKPDFVRIAGLWSALLGHEITPDDVALMMILLKVSREKHAHKEDNLVDIMGYALCREDLVDKEIPF